MNLSSDTKKVCLKAVMGVANGKRVWSGEYECSICGMRFFPDASDPAKLTREFDSHRPEHEAAAAPRQN